MTFQQLREAPRELWVMFLLKLFTSFAYFGLFSVLVLYLSREHGFSDVEAGAIYGVGGLSASLFGIVTGRLLDWLDVRRAVVLGALVTGAGMFIVALSYDRTTALLALLIVVPFGASLGFPAIDIGTKRYSSAANRRVAFSVLYSTMNVGAALSGLVLQALRNKYPPMTAQYSSERLLILLAACVTCASGLLSALLVRNVIVFSTGAIAIDPGELELINWRRQGSQETEQPSCCEVLRGRTLWQVAAFTSSLLFARQIFRQFDTTFPKWVLRVQGETAPIGLFFAINPTLIVFMSPLFAHWLAGADIYTVQMAGSLVSALSVFLLSFGSVGAVIGALVCFTVGEAIYSPTSTTIVMALSPNGQEGVYGSLSSVPLFLSALPFGIMSGKLTETYCPVDVSLAPDKAAAIERCGYIWVIVASVALVTPLLLLLLRRFIYTDTVRIILQNQTARHKEETLDPPGFL